MPQLRQSIITGDWVVFAPERAKRPSDYVWKTHEKQKSGDDCPFCIDSKISDYKSRIISLDRTNTYMMPNKYPAFVEDAQASGKTYKVEDKFYKLRRAYGGHDLVVVKDHNDEIMKFKKGVWKDIFDTFIDRYKYFALHDCAEYVMPIYNHGPEAAASIDHPHAQVFTSPIIPNIVAREIAYTKENYTRDKKCSFCQMIEHEKNENLRTIFENDDFIAFAYYAARFPFETWILPKKHQSHFENIDDDEKNNLINICQQVFAQLDLVLKNPPLNFFIHSAPLKEGDMPSYHWHIEIAPRLANYGGFEMGSGIIIDIINPELAADYLKIGQSAK